jgi:hypothetical protein
VDDQNVIVEGERHTDSSIDGRKKMSHLANLIHRPRDSDFVPSNTAQTSAQSSHPANLNH